MPVIFKKRPSWSLFFSFLLLLLISIPIIYIFANVFNPIKDTTKFFFEKSLFEYIKNSVILVFLTGFFASALGVFLAYFESFYEYKYKKFFKFALVLPFAIPSYLFAYIYTDFFSYSGWLISFLRNNFDIRIHFDIMNLWGGIFILSISFFPYIYIILRGFLAKFPSNLIESSKSLGLSEFQIFWRVLMPLSRPAIVAGASLCIMETLNAYGMPKYFGIEVFSTGIYKAWIDYSDLNAAIKLSAILLIFVFSLIILEKIFRKPFTFTTTKLRQNKLKKLSKKGEFWLVFGFSIVLFFSLILPIIHLFIWFSKVYMDVDYISLIKICKDTLFMTLGSTFLIIFIALFLNESIRNKAGLLKKFFSNLANLGYSIPGSVIAIGMLIIFIKFDHFLAKVYEFLGIKETLFLTLSPLILMASYAIRFLALGYNAIEAKLKALGNSFYEASLSLGKSKFQTFLRVDLPLLKLPIFSAFLLIFIEILKELPLSSLFASAEFTTLAFEISRYASDEELELSSAPALVTVFSSLLLLFIFNFLNKKRT